MLMKYTSKWIHESVRYDRRGKTRAAAQWVYYDDDFDDNDDDFDYDDDMFGVDITAHDVKQMESVEFDLNARSSVYLTV